MLEKIVKVAENCAKQSANSGCWPLQILHQTKMPKQLIKKEENK